MKLILVPMLPTLYGRRYQLCKHLASSGNEVHMILWDMPYPVSVATLRRSLAHAWSKQDYMKDGIHIHKVRRMPFFFPIVNRWLFRRQLRKIAAEFSIDAVISQSFFNETEPPEELPLYFDLNDNYESFARVYGSAVYKLSYKLLRVRHTVQCQLKRSAAVFAVSDMLVDYGKQFCNQVYKIPNGVDIPSEVALAKSKLTYGSHSLIYVSTFGKWSRVTDVIRIIADLKEHYPDIRLVLAGGGTELAAAKALVEELQLEAQVEVAGHISDRSQLFDKIANCRIGLNISEKNEFRDSASPIKLFEYSAFGKTVVSTNLHEVIAMDLPNTIIYDDAGGLEALKEAIIEAFGTNIDASAVQKHMFQAYNWKTLTDQMVAVMQKGKKA